MFATLFGATLLMIIVCVAVGQILYSVIHAASKNK